MAMKFSDLKNEEKGSEEEKGTWEPYAAGLELLLRPTRTFEYDVETQKILQRREFKGKLRRGKISPEKFMSVQKEVAAKHVLVGWRNLVDDDDRPIPYSWQKAFELFESNHQFFVDVVAMADGLAEEDEEDAEDAEGNSKESQLGTPDGGSSSES